MRTPCRNALIHHYRIFVLEGHTVALAGARQGVMDNFGVRLPVMHDLVQAIGREVLDELLHLGLAQTITIEIAGSFCHLEMNQRTVAIESDVFRAEDGHVVVVLAWGWVVAAITRS